MSDNNEQQTEQEEPIVNFDENEQIHGQHIFNTDNGKMICNFIHGKLLHIQIYEKNKLIHEIMFNEAGQIHGNNIIVDNAKMQFTNGVYKK